MNPAWMWLLPALDRFAPDERSGALEQARKTALDTFELLGMAAGLVAVTALAKYLVPTDALGSRALSILLNFVVAVPLLAVALGPFHLRRLRRGLATQLLHRKAA